jgi:hypothetical protein
MRLVGSIGVVAFMTLMLVVEVPWTRASGEPLTVAAYRKQANATCAAMNAWTPPVTGPVARDAAVVVRYESALASLRNLRPPAALAKLHTQVIAVEAKGLAYLSLLVARLKAGAITSNQLAVDFQRQAATWGAEEAVLWRKQGVLTCTHT